MKSASPGKVASPRSSSDTLDDQMEPEDHDDSPMRKRPRLGSVASREVLAVSSPVSDNHRLSEEGSQPSGSNVTLDLRPTKQTASSHSPRVHEPLSEDSLRALEAQTVESDETEGETIMVGGVNDAGSSNTLSSTGSPVIEIEILDDDSFETITRYDTLRESTRESPLARRILETFPMADNVGLDRALIIMHTVDRGKCLAMMILLYQKL